jgi:hypothetical protein
MALALWNHKYYTTMDIVCVGAYSMPAAAERLDALLPKAEEIENVGKMSAEGDGSECRPYRSRTCDTLIKRYRRIVPKSTDK